MIQALNLVHVAAIAPRAPVGGRDAFGPFAIVAEAHAVAAAEVPEESGGGGVHVIVAGHDAVLGIRSHPSALLVVGGDGGVAPTMAVHADLAVAEQIVEQHIFPGEAMLVGGDLLPVDGEVRVAVAGPLPRGVFEVAEHLVVGAILLDDVEHVFDRASLPDGIGDDGFARGWAPFAKRRGCTASCGAPAR